MAQPVTAVLVGAGNRGTYAYAPYALEYPDELRFVAVAEPHPVRRERFARAHNIPPERQFNTWEELLAQGQIADVLFNMTQDQTHYPSTIAALKAGYDVLLEKPMATRLEHVVDLVQTAERLGRLLQICHVLRYTAIFSALHEILASGRLGDIVTVEHRENVVYWHMAHSFVRGNWRNVATSSPMILAKCCHDFDILYWNLGRPAKRLQSFGSLIHFRPENAPAGATPRCTDGCPVEDCPFDARRIYLNMDYHDWPVSVITEDTGSAEARRQALATGPYGRCVYRCDNDVVDHQTVNMELENGISVVLVMHGHSHQEAAPCAMMAPRQPYAPSSTTATAGLRSTTTAPTAARRSSSPPGPVAMVAAISASHGPSCARCAGWASPSPPRASRWRAISWPSQPRNRG
jgi:hypothetical protein